MAAALVLAVPGGTAQARDSLGIFGSWGAFRDPEAPRCYAIARPARTSGDGRWQPFASVGYWPTRQVRGQVHIRLSREVATRSPILAEVGEQRFSLVGGGADAWMADKKGDAALIAAMRSGTSLSISARARTGAGFADAYALRGAATAIDAAALGCGRP